MFKTGTIELDEELFDFFLEGTLPLFHKLTYHEGFDERQPGRLVAAIRRDPQAPDVVTTFGLRAPTRQVAAYLLYEALLRSKAYEASAGADSALVREVLQAITKPTAAATTVDSPSCSPHWLRSSASRSRPRRSAPAPTRS